MLKCMLCDKTFETKPIPTGTTDVEKAKALVQASEQAAEGEKWEHVQVTVTRSGGRVEILAGHLCPDEKVEEGGVALVKA